MWNWLSNRLSHKPSTVLLYIVGRGTTLVNIGSILYSGCLRLDRGMGISRPSGGIGPIGIARCRGLRRLDGIRQLLP